MTVRSIYSPFRPKLTDLFVEPYKYEQISRELDRSMDEVITMAKDLQAVMDHAHDEGKMDTEGDRWTWHIWNPRPESQV